MTAILGALRGLPCRECLDPERMDLGRARESAAGIPERGFDRREER